LFIRLKSAVNAPHLLSNPLDMDATLQEVLALAEQIEQTRAEADKCFSYQKLFNAEVEK
jgi:hypothetical protein